MDDVMQIMKNAVYGALKAINPNTSPNYPANLLDGENPPNWPITVYTVKIDSDTVLQRRDRIVHVTVNLDHFATTQKELSGIGAQCKVAMMNIIPRCDTDIGGEFVAGRVFRRSQRYSGRWDLISGTVYE